MREESENWRETAHEAYRRGRLCLQNLKPPHSVEGEYFIEELQEALLDLKQAFIADEKTAAARHLAEIIMIMLDLGRLGLIDEENT
jgi:hypothetical protein